MVELVRKEDVLKAHEMLKKVVTHTELQYDDYLSNKYHCHVYLKREDLQKVRSFKLRGAYYAIANTPTAILDNGVVCASAGNHAQGVAYTCNKMKVNATIFMPTTTPNQKISQVKFFGEEFVTIRLVGDTFDASAEAAKRYAQEKNKAFIDPFNDQHIIAGQGTVAVEVFQDLAKEERQLDYIFTAIGGGGLISGISAYTKEKSPYTKIVGVEPNGAASMKTSIEQGKVIPLNQIDKFVDGAAVKEVGEINLEHAKHFVDDVVAVDEGLVCSTILELYTKQAIVAEPAGALSVSVLERYKEKIVGKTVVCVISGGNNDISRMQEIEERSLLYEGLKHYFVINFPQRAGALKEFVTDVLGPRDDITKFEYTKKVNRGSGPVVIGILLNDQKDIASLLERMSVFDPNYINLNENQSLFTLLV
ncbi:threonine ammonia-lyase IlvA [Vagococcus elongatus]|uniref:L-threonine dehydratase n=1 Tax=Vagococcus elongatus TaxID=180344 RepID=A0A430AQX8_9ENTE|nr:threonine ammonia-lyase IlvA [Vagococcus elongatus]RSU10317.1 threonine dehydratase [Vagococcus elongatus]